MDIVKAFNENDLNIDINIQGSSENPLFRASDIGLILDISQIRSSIRHFDETQKVVQIVHTIGGPQEVTFLTEFGLYEILFRSKKNIAKKFKKWVCEIIREIRINKMYELKKEVEDNIYKLQIKGRENEKDKERIMIDQNPRGCLCIYYGTIDNKSTTGESLIKFGRTNDLGRRIKEHKKNFDNFKILNVYRVSNHIEIENIIKTHEKLKKKRRNIILDEKNYTELLLNDNTEQIDDMIKGIIEENEYNLENYKRLLKEKKEIEEELNLLKQEYKEFKDVARRKDGKD